MAGLLRKAEALADSSDYVADDKAHWNAVRSLIVKANRADNDNPVALFRYYQSYRRQGIEPSKIAVEGLFRAFDLAPQSDEIRMAIAQQLVIESKFKSARNVLMPIAYAPHGGDGRDMARDIIASIDAKDSSSVKTTAMEADLEN